MNSPLPGRPTISWLLGEASSSDHARRSVAPERLAKALLGEQSAADSGSGVIDEGGYWDLTHLRTST
jgi:pyruvate-ferredoxin/flavodoxin oxidoreductase